MENLRHRALIVGLENDIEVRVRRILDKLDIRKLGSAAEFIAEIESEIHIQYQIAVCGPALEGVSPAELAQSLRTQLVGNPLLFVTSEKFTATYKELLKNGFDRAFFLPLDGEQLDRSLKLTQGELLGIKVQTFVSVPLDDLADGAILDFDVMALLPLNQRYVRLFKAGTRVRPEMLAKLEKNGNRIVFINETDRDKFERLRMSMVKAGGTTKISTYERLGRVREAVRTIFHELLAPTDGSFDDGKRILGSAQELVSDLITKSDVESVLSEVFRNCGHENGDAYSQSIRIATFASMFSMAIKTALPEDLAVAGLFHHAGLARLPEELLKKPWSQMSSDEKAIYSRHPEEALRLCMAKRIILVPDVQAAILQHHERIDGSGFPKALTEAKVSPGAQLLAIASQFDTLTTLELGRKSMDPFAALEAIAQTKGMPTEMARNIHRSLSAAVVGKKVS